MTGAGRNGGTPVQGADYRDGDKQRNYFAPITKNMFTGAFERLRDVCFDPAPLARDLDVARFTGRDRLIQRIDGFIRERPRGYVIIKAGSGVGKSALAAHLVGTRPWLHHFTWLPGGRSPEAARKSLAAQLIARWSLLYEWAPDGVLPPASADPGWFAGLLDAAAAKCRGDGTGERVVLVVDDLDEFEAAETPAGRGLALGLPDRLPDGVFVVATSRLGIDPAGDPAGWLQVEIDGADNRDDLRRFIENVTSPDGGDPRLTEPLVRAGADVARFRRDVARACAGVWIYLRYVLDEIRDGATDPRGASELPGDLASYYAEQVRYWRGDPDSEAAARRWETVRLPLLGVLAAARAPLAVIDLASFAGVSGAEPSRAFIEETALAFLSRDDGGSAEAGEPGGLADPGGLAGPPRYALRHRSLRDLLTGSVPAERPDLSSLARLFAEQAALAQQQITAALIPPGAPAERNWDGAGEYARYHLAAHAAACGTLDSLASDPGFLLMTDPASFLAQRASLRTQDGRRSLAAFELSLGDGKGPAGAEPAERMARLAASATRVHAATLAAACAQRSADEWPANWAAWASQGYRQLTGHDDWVFAVATGRVGERDVFVSGDSDGTAQLWDPITGFPVGEPLGGGGHAVYAVAIGRAGDRDLVVSGYRDGTVRTWDAATGDPAGPELTGHHAPVTAVATGRLGGRDVIISGSRDGTVRTWDARSGEPADSGLAGIDSEVTAVATGRAGGRDVIVTGYRDGTVRTWDAATGDPAGSPFTGHRDAVTTVATGRAGDRDVIVSGDAKGTVLVYEYRPG